MGNNNVSTKSGSGRLLLNILVVLAVTFWGALIIDGFLLHPIPAQSTLDWANPATWSIDLVASDTNYTDATIIDRLDSGNGNTIVVEKEGKMYVLSFDHNTVTNRWALKDEIVVEPGMTGLVEVGSGFNRTSVEFQDGEILDFYTTNMSGGIEHIEIAWYFFLAVGVTAIEAVLFSLLTKKRRRE